MQTRFVQRVSQTRPDCRIQLLIKHHCSSTFPASIASTDEPNALVPKQDGGGTPLAVINPSPIEEIRKESSSRVTASDELCLTEKAGVTGIDGKQRVPFLCQRRVGSRPIARVFSICYVLLAMKYRFLPSFLQVPTDRTAVKPRKTAVQPLQCRTSRASLSRIPRQPSASSLWIETATGLDLESRSWRLPTA